MIIARPARSYGIIWRPPFVFFDYEAISAAVVARKDGARFVRCLLCRDPVFVNEAGSIASYCFPYGTSVHSIRNVFRIVVSGIVVGEGNFGGVSLYVFGVRSGPYIRQGTSARRVRIPGF